MYLYVIKSQHLYKIGITENVAKRLKELATSNPFGLKVIYSFEFENASEIELMLHRKYKTKRIAREWFALTKSDVMFLRTFIPGQISKQESMNPLWSGAKRMPNPVFNPVLKGFKDAVA